MAQTPMFIGVQSVGRASALVGALMALMAYWDRWDPAPSLRSGANRFPPFCDCFHGSGLQVLPRKKSDYQV